MAQKIRNSRYNRKRSPALIIRKSNPQTTILLFRTERALIFTSAGENFFPYLARTLEKDWQKVLNTKTLKITNLVVYNMMAKF
jgi:TATA-box binding protein (TBP) (component of TFIID and TFIIIB)